MSRMKEHLANLPLPIVHLNGTSREALIEPRWARHTTSCGKWHPMGEITTRPGRSCSTGPARSTKAACA